MKKENSLEQIYVALLDENVDVWHPVKAEKLKEGIYRILPQPYNRDVEKWEFEPGDIVICEYITSADGKIFAAIKRE